MKQLDMDCSNHDIDPELRDPLLDTYHCEGASEPNELQSHRPSSVRRTRTLPLDFCN
jgi:hypothetical protein